MTGITTSELNRLGVQYRIIGQTSKDGITFNMLECDSKYVKIMNNNICIYKCLKAMNNLVDNLPVSLRVFSRTNTLLRENIPISSFKDCMFRDKKSCKLNENGTHIFDAILNSINHQIHAGSISRTTFIVLTDGIDT